MSEELNSQTKESAGCFGIGVSFLIPIVGIILYYSKKSDSFDAKPYLYAAIAGFVAGTFLKVIA